MFHVKQNLKKSSKRGSKRRKRTMSNFKAV